MLLPGGVQWFVFDGASYHDYWMVWFFRTYTVGRRELADGAMLASIMVEGKQHMGTMRIKRRDTAENTYVSSLNQGHIVGLMITRSGGNHGMDTNVS